MSKDKKLGLGAMLLGLAISIYSQMIQVRVELNEPGPRLFPLIAGIGILLSGVGIFCTAAAKEQEKVFLGKDGLKRLAVSMAVLVLYALALKLVGFVPATPFAVVALSRVFSQKKYNYVIGAVVGIVTTAVLYGLFSAAFHLNLPSGILF